MSFLSLFNGGLLDTLPFPRLMNNELLSDMYIRNNDLHLQECYKE